MNFKRNLIALAVGSAFVAPAAMAEVTVYGQAQVELASTAPEQDGVNDCSDYKTCDGVSLQDNQRGRIGVKASEDLGNGWKALAKAEYDTDFADGGARADDDSSFSPPDSKGRISGSFQSRELMVGLKGSAVQIEAGRLKQPYKYTGGVKYDPFVATTLEARGNAGMEGGEFGQSSFHSDAISVQNTSGPVKVWVLYGPEEDNGFFNASVSFSQDNFEVFLAANDQGDLATPDKSNTKVGGQFKMGNHKISAQYEMIDNGTSADPTYLFVGWQGKFGKNTFVAQLGMNDKDTGNSDADEDYFAIGAIHKFTKTTRIFGGVRNTSGGASGSETGEQVISVGLRMDFSS